MARAGYCSACANYVFLTPAGGCSNGHGPEYISNAYDVPDAAAAVPPVAYQPPAAPQPAAYAPPAAAPAAYPAAYPAAPKKKKTGLIVAIVLIVLLLCCCGTVAALMLSGTIANPLSSPERQKVTAAGGFFKAIMKGDAVGLAKLIPAEANAVMAQDPDLLMNVLGELEAQGTLDSETWDGDVLTQQYTSNEGDKAKLTYTAEADSDRVVVTVEQESEASDDPAYITLVKEGTGWKVLAFGTEDYEFIRFDAETIKELQESADQ